MRRVEDKIATYKSQPPRTKVACSVRCDTDFQTLRQLILGGMNVIKINSTYGSYKELSDLILRVNDAASTTKRLVSIILETHGKHIWTGPHAINNDIQNNFNQNFDNLANIDNMSNDSNDNNNNGINTKENQSTTMAKFLGLKSLPKDIENNMDFALRILSGEFDEDNENNENKDESKDNTNDNQVKDSASNRYINILKMI